MTPRARLALRNLTVTALCLPSLACGAGWRTVAPPEPASYPPHQQAQIWRAGRATQVHGLRLTVDSVSAIPYLQPLTCGSCRIAIPRAQVDSIRLGDPSRGLWGSTGLVVLGLLVAAVILCATGPECDIGS